MEVTWAGVAVGLLIGGWLGVMFGLLIAGLLRSAALTSEAIGGDE